MKAIGLIRAEREWSRARRADEVLHDKIEGVATPDAGQTLYLSNDNDFGIDFIGGVSDAAPTPDPVTGAWEIHQKVLPATGQVDDGEILKVDTTKLPAVLKTVTVTIHVG